MSYLKHPELQTRYWYLDFHENFMEFIYILIYLEFEINISVVFEDNHLVSENFPIQLTRF